MFPSGDWVVAAGSSKTVNVPRGLNRNPWEHVSLAPVDGFTQGMEKLPTISPASLMPDAAVELAPGMSMPR
jgi:hypothetical protein